jgi:hypothetical protein
LKGSPHPTPLNNAHAAKLKEGGNYPAREIMGSGAFQFVEHVQGSHWTAKRFEGYFKLGRPYLDGYKAYFIKSTAVIPGLSVASSTPSSGSGRCRSATFCQVTLCHPSSTAANRCISVECQKMLFEHRSFAQNIL